jgi:hypothetical protein
MTSFTLLIGPALVAVQLPTRRNPELSLSNSSTTSYLPVGKRVRLYKPYYEAQCPSCDAPEEDRAHMFHCLAADRELWRKEFLKKLAKKCTDLCTDPALQSVMVKSLECILYDTTLVVNEPPRLLALCSEQDSIGWHQLFLGRFSKKWVQLQNTYIHNSGLTPNYCNHGTPWLQQIIHFLWSECKKLWSLRNEA